MNNTMYNVMYEHNVNFEGRNGYFKQSGISIMRSGSEISLFPITSKRVIGRCMVEIPLDKIDEVINVLQQCKNNIRID